VQLIFIIIRVFQETVNKGFYKKVTLNECKMYFEVSGNKFNFTNFISIDSSDLYIINENTDSWSISSTLIKSEVIDIYDMCDSLINQLLPYENKLADVIQANNLISKLEIVLWISTDSSISTPAIGFNSESINFFSKMGSFIDIDTYKV
jgi:hypothetical protein